MTLEETLPVDSENPNREDIFTSRNERAAPSHYETQKLSDIGEIFETHKGSLTQIHLFIEGAYSPRSLNST